jgi:phospholipid transport system substrate-binding protein
LVTLKIAGINMKSLFYAVISFLLLSQPVAADDKVVAEEFLKCKLDAVFAVLQTEDLQQEAKNKAVVDIVTPMFDFALMAKLCLGKKYWPDLTEENKVRFTDLFIKRLRTSYLDKLTIYTDEKVIYEPPVQVKEKIHVPTYLVSKEKKISMRYKLYKSKHTWKIYDVEIQGVSIIRSYRAQFTAILENGTMDDLLLKMEESVAN